MIHSPLGSRYAIGGALGRSVKRAGSAWSPIDIAGCALWLDFSDATSLFVDAGTTPVSADGQAIYQANDKSGNNNHISQGTTDYMALYKTNIKNGLSVIRFAGNDFYKYGTALLSSNFTVIFAGDANDNTIGSYIIAEYNGTKRSNLTRYTSGGFFTITTYTVAGGYVAKSISDADGWNLLSGVCNDSTRSIYKNGVAGTGTSNAIASNSVVRDIGRGSTDARYYFIGDMGELIVYNSALSDANRQIVEAYINTKWAIYS